MNMVDYSQSLFGVKLLFNQRKRVFVCFSSVQNQKAIVGVEESVGVCCMN